MNKIIFRAVAVTGLVVALGMPAVSADAASTHFANCTAMHHVYKHGVGKTTAHDKVRGKTKPVTNFKRSNALYAANKKSDRDHDGVACEAR
jgi:hypothetical protein